MHCQPALRGDQLPESKVDQATKRKVRDSRIPVELCSWSTLNADWAEFLAYFARRFTSNPCRTRANGGIHVLHTNVH